MEELTGMTKQEAYLLAGISGHVRPGQAQISLYSMRCLVPKKYLPKRRTDSGRRYRSVKRVETQE
jgi:hypothetical protein